MQVALIYLLIGQYVLITFVLQNVYDHALSQFICESNNCNVSDLLLREACPYILSCLGIE